MSELALDDVDRHALAREFDRMRVAQLMGREPASDPSIDGELAQLGPRRGRRPAAATGATVDHAEQRSGRQQHPLLNPRPELLEPELIHPRFAALVTFAVAHQ